MIPNDDKFIQGVKKHLKDRTSFKVECPKCGGIGLICLDLDYNLQNGIILDCCPVCLGNKFIFLCKPDK